jgi:hypothetical protein
MQALKAMLRNDRDADAARELPRTMRLPSNGGENRTLLRFTRARKDTEKSYQMLRKSLAWRAEVGADDCLSKPLATEHAATLAAIPGFYVGHGKKGHPVFLDHTAVVPWDLILDEMGMSLFLYAQVQLLEYTQAVVYKSASAKHGSPITQGVNIWDVKGLTLTKFTAKVREISSATSKIAQDNYPESLAAAYVINAPAIFKVVWAVISTFLDPKTVAKVHIYGSGPKAFAKLKAALGEDCFLTEEMVCCPTKEVGEAEKTMGLQSGMAAAQPDVNEVARPSSPGVLRRIFAAATSTAQESNEDEFFDATDDAFSAQFGDFDALENNLENDFDEDGGYVAMPAAPPSSGSTPGSTPDTSVKLIAGNGELSSDAVAAELAKDDAARRGKKKSCCGLC